MFGKYVSVLSCLYAFEDYTQFSKYLFANAFEFDLYMKFRFYTIGIYLGSLHVLPGFVTYITMKNLEKHRTLIQTNLLFHIHKASGHKGRILEQ